MKRRGVQAVLFPALLVACLIAAAHAARRPDVTRHEATFLESKVNLYIEWQSVNPVISVRISMANIEKEIKVDPYDNRRNRDGYAGELNVTLELGPVSGQSLNYVIQLEDELRIKGDLVRGKVLVVSTQQPDSATQSKQPAIQIEIQQDTSKPDGQASEQPGVKSAGQNVGVLVVIIAPQVVAENGAMWRVGDGPWRKSGESIADLPSGVHTIEFQEMDEWVRPLKRHVTIEHGKTIKADGLYKRK